MRPLPVLLLVAACVAEEDPLPPDDSTPGTRDVTLRFEAVVGDRGVDCRADYPGLGATQALARISDLRLFVHGVQLLDEDGEPVDVELHAEAPWQDGAVALLDFETGDGFCEGGTPEIRDVVTGSAPDVPVAGVAFSLGVPAALNHPRDASALQPPLDVPELLRNPTVGYWHFRLGLRTSAPGGAFPVYIGASGCSVDGGGAPSCTSENVVRVELPAFDPDEDVVALDLAALLATSILDADAGGQPGCQSLVGDPECQAIFTAYGLGAASPRFVGVR